MMIQKIAIGTLKIIHNAFLNLIMRKKSFQFFFEYLHTMALEGMNYANGGTIENNGELSTLKYIRDKLISQNNIIIFDVGANSGNYSLNVLNVFKEKNLTLYSFEPAQKNFRLLEKTLSGDKVKLHKLGIGNQNGKAILHSFSNDIQGQLCSLYRRNLKNRDIETNNYETIELTTIDSFCQQNSVEKIDFLKLDIEGHEIKAIDGAEEMIKEDKIKFIQFEFGGTDIDSRVFFRDFFYLLKDKYDLYRIVQNGIHPIDKYWEHLEIFSMINFLAEHK